MRTGSDSPQLRGSPPCVSGPLPFPLPFPPFTRGSALFPVLALLAAASFLASPVLAADPVAGKAPDPPKVPAASQPAGATAAKPQAPSPGDNASTAPRPAAPTSPSIGAPAPKPRTSSPGDNAAAAPRPAAATAPSPPGTSGSRGTTLHDPVTGTKFVLVKGGCFRMGNPDPVAESDERPVHEVCVSDFYMATTEVTQGDWEKVNGWNPSLFKGNQRHPVEWISWNDTQGFISRLNGLSGMKFRLPTEAEWEFAAAGGTRARKPGEKPPPLDETSWYSDSSDGETQPVGEMNPNQLGLYDMLGNVWEWCSDWYDPGYYRQSPKKDPKGPETGSDRVLRGGSWADPPPNLRVTERGALQPEDRSETHGFRLALSP